MKLSVFYIELSMHTVVPLLVTAYDSGLAPSERLAYNVLPAKVKSISLK